MEKAASLPLEAAADKQAPRSLFTVEDTSYSAAMRAADALFGKIQPDMPASRAPDPVREPLWPASETTPPAIDGEQRSPGRILPTLGEVDPLVAIMAAQEEAKRRAAEDSESQDVQGSSTRGRRASPVRSIDLEDLDASSEAHVMTSAPQPVAPTKPARSTQGRIPGYVRGSIYMKWVIMRPKRNAKRKSSTDAA